MSHDIIGSVPPANAPGAEGHGGQGRGNFGLLTLGSLGIVFGDIGTSPLYALKAALGQLDPAPLSQAAVIGTVSLIIWALLIVVTGKYVSFVMQADNKGEGGILSLNALARTAIGRQTG